MDFSKFSSLISLFFSFFLSIFILFQSNAKLISVIEPSQEHTREYKSQPILEIDIESIKLVEEIGGGIYHSEVDAIVPFFPSLVRAKWLNVKNEIAQRIGPLNPTSTKESTLWKNSATSVESLIKDAQIAAPYFLEKCVLIANKTGTIANFGIGNQYIIKSKKSMERKVKESMLEYGISEEEAVNQMRDSLRGTIIAQTPEQIPLVVQALTEFANEEGREIVFINIWEDNRPSGYVGIHAKMLFPIYDANEVNTQRNIIVEIQIHLSCIMDGTKKCAKEREHLLYEKIREGEVDPEIQTSASTLLYLTALKQCPPKNLNNLEKLR
jgi:hypothetical protein